MNESKKPEPFWVALIRDCNDVLSSAGMNGISYSSKTGEIERVCGNIEIMNAYIGNIRTRMSEYIMHLRIRDSGTRLQR